MKILYILPEDYTRKITTFVTQGFSLLLTSLAFALVTDFPFIVLEGSSPSPLQM